MNRQIMVLTPWTSRRSTRINLLGVSIEFTDPPSSRYGLNTPDQPQPTPLATYSSTGRKSSPMPEIQLEPSGIYLSPSPLPSEGFESRHGTDKIFTVYEWMIYSQGYERESRLRVESHYKEGEAFTIERIPLGRSLGLSHFANAAMPLE